ncbi:MAG: heat-inducible transcription repressor HrcA [Clostridia bacterium]|nr:heat-inducible transcription repressor HrcA [Clostridia bacterium]
MELSERKEKILRAIVDDYIMSAEPVGSAYILENHELGVSSATVRNEMAALEEAGYLEKPHTSSGRVPSVLGYRTYVNSLMKEYSLTLNEMAHIRNALAHQYMEFDKALSSISEIVSFLTNYTAVFTTPVSSKYNIRQIKLISVDPQSFVMIVVLNEGVVKNRTMRVKKPYEAEVLDKLSNYLNNKFAGINLNALTDDILDEEKALVPVESYILDMIFDFISELAKDTEDYNIVCSGTTNIFNHPEFNDINKTKDFLNFVRSGNSGEIKEILKKASSNAEPSVIMGDDNPLLKEHGLSMVVSDYSLGNDLKGKMAIVGPTRMDYAKVISTLNYMSQHIKGLIGETDENTDK